MLTYSLLNLAFFAVLAGVMAIWRVNIAKKPILYTLIILLVLTLIFDTLIIAAGIVAYDTSLILPIRIINIPPEDFAYAIMAAILIPYLWNLFGSKRSTT